jgi:hypothetical protein
MRPNPRRDLTQHGVLSCLAGGEEWAWGKGAVISTVMDGPYRLPYGLYRLPAQGAAQLRALSMSSCWCWHITQCTLWTVITESHISGRVIITP